MLELDSEIRQIISTTLVKYGLQDYLPLVEDIMLGRAAPGDVFRFINVACQTSYLKGSAGMAEGINRSYKKAGA